MVSDHTSQMLKGILDMCLLSVIGEAPTYGYEMVSRLRGRGLELVSEGSIYPLLARLQRSGMIEGYLVESDSGPARKYYRLEAAGEEALVQWRREWDKFSDGVEAVLAPNRPEEDRDD